MYRRTVLAALAPFLVGCTSSNSSKNDDSSTTSVSRTATVTRNTITTRNDTKTVEQIYEPIFANRTSISKSEIQQQFVNRDCTEFVRSQSICATDTDDQLDVSVSPTIGQLSNEGVEFRIENSTDEEFKTNHYEWVLRKWDGSQWRRLAPLSIPAPLDTIPAGGSYSRKIIPSERKPVRSSRAYMRESDVTLGGLGPGVYGFSMEGYFPSASDEEIALAARFGFAGEAPPVRPTDDVTGVERSGSTLVVHAEAPADRRGELVVSLETGEADAHLLAEHVHQLRALSNTLPYAASDGVETIRYIGHEDDVGVADSYVSAVTPNNVTRYGFDDYVFELSVEAA